MQDGHDGLVVQVEHAAGDLHRPVHQDVRGDAAASAGSPGPRGGGGGQGPIEGAAAGELHDEAEVGLPQADPVQGDDVRVPQHGKELGLLPHALRRGRDVLVGVLPRCLHGHLLAPPGGPVHLPEAPDADDLLQLQVLEVDLRQAPRGIPPPAAGPRRPAVGLAGHVVGGEDAEAVADLPRPPAVVAGHGRVLRQHLHHVPPPQAQLVLTVRLVVVQRRPQRARTPASGRRPGARHSHGSDLSPGSRQRCQRGGARPAASSPAAAEGEPREGGGVGAPVRGKGRGPGKGRGAPGPVAAAGLRQVGRKRARAGRRGGEWRCPPPSRLRALPPGIGHRPSRGAERRRRVGGRRWARAAGGRACGQVGARARPPTRADWQAPAAAGGGAIATVPSGQT